ncbi:protein APCDD1 isoform X1 [Lingula anatina]|uniref:Protein APCDD1 isoform X1 n=1 Tax=Lingula anatina TaxID=7574 RepID=A0A1S3KAJ4_LINAN|nr:protein APCDD1 isoform X1 [Lingula anatina]|eukprot:XP_013419658.1 protein APCDD1 isoform X1 [Lingula anatina]
MELSGGSLYVALCRLIWLAVVLVQGSSSGTQVKHVTSTCRSLAEHASRERVVVQSLNKITGQWVSERCEVRPGPEFLLRSYKFQNDSRYTAHQYFYADPACSVPLYSVVSRGKLENIRDSWTIPGAAEVDYQLSQVTLTPYEERQTMVLERMINSTCPELVKSRWRSYSPYDIYNYVEVGSEGGDGIVVLDRDCTSVLYFSIHELQLIRIEQRHHHRRLKTELFLGDIHTDKTQRASYRPKGFQPPLVRTDSYGCHLCDKMKFTNELEPPRLRVKSVERGTVDGDWISTRCETRPNSIFVKRRLHFNLEDSTWHGFYSHFTDPLCAEPSFTLSASGTFTNEGPSAKVPGAREFKFSVTVMKIRPDTQTYANNLNAEPVGSCGIPGKWETGAFQDVQDTGGCTRLGVSVPYVEYEILKLETTHRSTELYLGQRPSDGAQPSSPSNRPTSFQPPLRKCLAEVEQKATVQDYSVDSGCACSVLSTYCAILALILSFATSR